MSDPRYAATNPCPACGKRVQQVLVMWKIGTITKTTSLVDAPGPSGYIAPDWIGLVRCTNDGCALRDRDVYVDVRRVGGQ